MSSNIIHNFKIVFSKFNNNVNIQKQPCKYLTPKGNTHVQICKIYIYI